MLLVVGYGSPLPASAPLGETNLPEALLDQYLSPRQPTQLVYDREPDSDDRRERSRSVGLTWATSELARTGRIVCRSDASRDAGRSRTPTVRSINSIVTPLRSVQPRPMMRAGATSIS